MIEGSCLCGRITFDISGEITPIQLCHARRCRKATGGAFAPEALCRREALRWRMGSELLIRFEAPLLKRPPAYVRCFCGVCGSPMPAEIPGTPFVLVNPGVLDGDPGSREFRHAFTAQKACWHEIGAALPQYPGQPPVPEEWGPPDRGPQKS